MKIKIDLTIKVVVKIIVRSMIIVTIATTLSSCHYNVLKGHQLQRSAPPVHRPIHGPIKKREQHRCQCKFRH